MRFGAILYVMELYSLTTLLMPKMVFYNTNTQAYKRLRTMRTEMVGMKKANKRLVVMLLAVLLAITGMVCTASAEEVYDRDGSRIEGIDLFWLTPDSTVDNEGNPVSDTEKNDNGSARHDHLYLATRSDAALNMTYQFEVSFSGQYDYAPGDIQITIPAQVWHARDTSDAAAGKVHPTRMIGSMDLSVPAAPSKKSDFNWQLINGNYVLTNTKTIGATSKAMFQMSITNLVPHTIVDMSQCDPITVHVDVVTNRGNVISRTSDPITAQIDTIAEITGAKKATNDELYVELPSAIPAELLENLPEGTDPDDYIYVRWYSYVYHTANQPFSLDIEDTLGDAYKQVKDASGNVVDEEFVTEGILLGFTNYDGTVPTEGDHDLEARVLTNGYCTSSGSYDHTVYMWSAYKKDDFYIPTAREGQVVYVMRNNADWILTEYDAQVEDPGYDKPTDVQKVTTAPCNAAVYYMPTRWSKPTGHFEVFKWTENQPNEDWHYGYGLNQLIDEEDVKMNFHLKTVGFGYPWTSVRTNPADPDYVGEEDVTAEDFGNLGWRQITEDFDQFFDNNPTSLTERDFEITYLRVTVPQKLRYQKAGYPRYGYYDVNGNIVYGRMMSNEYGYFTDSSLPTPDLKIEYQLSGGEEWIHAATANWGEDGKGEFRFIDVAEGITTDGMRVYFPENTTDVRHIFVSNVYNGKSAEKCDLGAVQWDVYLGIDLKASAENIAIAENWFRLTDTPSTKFRNDVHMFVDGWIKANEDGTPGEGVRLYPDHPNAFFDTSRATIAGASYGVSLSKSVDFDGRSMPNGGDNDVENRQAILHYSAVAREQSNLTNRADYDKAVAEGVIPAETKGVWYDLLPEGVVPRMNTIRLRSGDTITAKYTIPDYKGTGRILLVVEADLTPAPSLRDGGYADCPSISFDAVYPWDAIEDFGTEAVNYIAFESKADNLRYNTLGTISGQRGNPDDPTAKNNLTTPSIPADIALALTDLDPETDENRFLYGKASVRLDLLTMAVSGIAKTVQNDLVGMWTQGLADQEQVTVYEGHNYTYRLRVASSESTVTSDIIIYDTIENYHIPDPANEETNDATKEADFNDKESKKNWQGDWQGIGQWRGTLESVDLTEFVQEGVAPVLYYSLIPDLTFADSTPGMSQDDRLELFSKGAYDLTDSSVWNKADLTADGMWVVPAELHGKISAVALDARKTADGEAYVLGEGEAISGYLHMVAPDDDGDPDVWHAKGAYAHKTDADGTPLQEIDWEKAAADPANNMYAFNNTRLKCVQSGVGGTGESSNIMIRNDYTRVGILPNIRRVEKVWQDQNNHDNIRPEEVTVTLLRKTVGMAGDFEEVKDVSGAPMTVKLNADNNWMGYFYQMDVMDESGNLYLYSFKENEIEGYTLKITDKGNGKFVLTNSHPNEQIELKGEKQWNDNDNALGLRPESITVMLYRDGEYLKKQTVTPRGGEWTYNFGKLDKYEQGGRPYEYTVEEEYVPKYAPVSESYQLLVNDYVPYGDLSVLKTLKDATPKAAENEFTFTIKLLAETPAGEDPVPLMDEYAYKIFALAADGESWEETGATGTITCSDTFTLMGDEKIVIYDLPSESTYEIQEAERAGFELTGKVNDTGTIRAGQLTEAEFTNTYSATGAVQFNAYKSQKGHALRKNQHQFQIIDKTEGSATYNQEIRTAYSGTPTNTQDIREGEVAGVITAHAIASFGQLDYTHKDDGKTFTYEVAEVIEERPGYTFDETRYTVTVKVTDNGDGTLNITAKNEDGNDVTLADGSNLSFENIYRAEGQISLKAWKVLEKRELQNGEFTFELYKYDNATGKTVGDPIATAQNDSDGDVVFPALHFDQDDVSMHEDEPAKYYYLVKEKVGTDATVVYSDQVYKYEVTVYDNHDGTLSFTEGTQVGVRNFEKCDDCYGTGLGLIEFGKGSNPSQKGLNVYSWLLAKTSNYNDYDVTAGAYFCPIDKDDYTKSIKLCKGCRGLGAINGSSRMCYMCGGSGLEENQVIKTHPTISNSDYGYNIETELVLGEKFVGAIKDRPSQSYVLADKFSYLRAYGTSETHYIPVSLHNPSYDGTELKACQTCAGTGKVEAGVTVTGEQSMPVFVNDLKPGMLTVSKDVYYPSQYSTSAGDTQFGFKVRFTGEMPKELDVTRNARPDPTPMPDNYEIPSMPVLQPYRARSSELRGEGLAVLNRSTGQFVFFRATPSGGTYRYRGAASNRSTISFSFPSGANRTTKTVNGVKYVFFRNIENLRPSSSGSVTWPWRPEHDYLYVNSISMEGAIKLGTTARGMFNQFSPVNTANLSKLDTSNVTDMEDMFYMFGRDQDAYTALTGLNFDTSKVTNMREMFMDARANSLNLTSFDTSKVTNMYWMFYGCPYLEEVDVSRFNTSNVTTMQGMFQACPQLQYVDASSFDTRKVTTMESMFYGCKNLIKVDVSGFDTSNVADMHVMFAYSNIGELDISHFDTTLSKANGDNLFNGAQIQKLTLGDKSKTNCKQSYHYPIVPTTSPFDGYWVNKENPSQVYTSYQLFSSGGRPGTWVWHVSTYTIHFEPGEGAGAMPDMVVPVKRGCSITPGFYRFGYKLTGFKDQNGRMWSVYTSSDSSYMPYVSIYGTYQEGDKVILTAQWEKLDDSLDQNSVEYFFKLKEDESITFNNIPAGTAYEVWEATTDGWRIYQKSGDIGVIEPLKTDKAEFVNIGDTYNVNVYLRASKTIDGKFPEPGEYSFQLLDSNGNVLQTVTNGEGGAVQFAPLSFNGGSHAGKGFNYKIREVPSINHNYQTIYDTSVYDVTVAVYYPGNSTLTSSVYYYKDSVSLSAPPVFKNETCPGGLRLVKGMSFPAGMTYRDPVFANTAFTFEVTLTDKFGKPWNGDEQGKVYLKRYINNQSNPVIETYDVDNGVVQVPMTIMTGNAVLYGIPKDTHYSVKEIGTYPGWEQEDYAYSNATGVIQPYSHRDYPESTGTTTVLVNRYTHKGTAVVEAVKNLIGRTPAEGEFTFQLVDSTGAVIDTATNEAGTGKVVFGELSYDKIGTYTYTIREVAGDDETVEYSDEEIAVTVVMEDKEGEGRLTPTITYRKNGVEGDNTIINKVKPGALEIGKTVVSSNQAHAQKEFTFTLYLSDALGQLLDGEYALSNGDTLTVTDGSGTLKLKHGDTVTVEGLPDGASYSVVEAAEGGFTQKSTGATGKIWASQTAQAKFTNTYHAEGEYTFEGVKTLEGKELEADQFLFELYDSEGYVLESVTNEAEGNFAFEKLEFTEEDVGEKSYIIAEKNTAEPGVTYDETSYEITLTISDNGDGTLSVEAEGIPEGGITFVNTYSNEITITATKQWKGDEEHTDARRDITVTLYRKVGSGEKVAVDSRTIPADAEGEALTVIWEDLPVFEIENGTAMEIEYSVGETMAYGEDEKNPYVSSVQGNAKDGFTIINRYAYDGVQIGVVKNLIGHGLAEGQFEFRIMDEQGNVLGSAANTADGTVQFPVLAYTVADILDVPVDADGCRTKTIELTISEVDDGQPGYTYDHYAESFIVTLHLDADSNLTAECSMASDDVVFYNLYKAEGETVFSGTKLLEGRALAAGEFSFTLYDADGNEIETVQNNADGSFAFAPLHYTEQDLGEYTYTVRENEGTLKGITYDSTEYTVTVNVTDNHDGTLKVLASENATALNFINAYDADGELTLRAGKTVNGAEPREDEVFTFRLCDAEGEELQTAENQKGRIAFRTLKYTEADAGKTFLYTVREMQEEKPGYTADATVYTVEVQVTDAGDGTLKVTRTITCDGNAVRAMSFDNRYEAEGEWTPTALKTVNGAEPREDQVYEFTLTDGEGNTFRAENEKGSITFEPLCYDESDIGKTYTYTVQESTASEGVLIADASVYTVEVTVTDNRDGTLKAEPVITKDGETVEAITFENVLTTQLSISKTVEGIETTETFPVTVELYNADGSGAAGEYPYTGDAEGLLKSGDEILLAHGQRVTISGLLPGMTYTVTETAPVAFEPFVNGNAAGAAQGTLTEEGSEVNFVNKHRKLNFTVNKLWQGGGGGEIELTLYANGKRVVPQPACTRDGDVYSYTGLPMYDEQDQLIVYSAKEEYFEGFLTIYQNVAPYAGKTKAVYNGGTIINKLIRKADFAVQKVWEGLSDGDKTPDIVLMLYCNGEAIPTKTPSPDGNGWYRFYDLPDTVDGKPAVYTVKEIAVDGFDTAYTLADGSSAEYADNGGTITNTKLPQTGDRAPLALWLTLMGASAAMLLMLLCKRRKA